MPLGLDQERKLGGKLKGVWRKEALDADVDVLFFFLSRCQSAWQEVIWLSSRGSEIAQVTLAAAASTVMS